jgi:hypothetical protein
MNLSKAALVGGLLPILNVMRRASELSPLRARSHPATR